MSIEDEAHVEAERRYRLDAVSVDNAPNLAELNERVAAGNGFIAGAEWLASRKPEAAPSDTDLAERAMKTADYFDAAGEGEIEAWSGGNFTTDDLRALAAGFSRSQPVQVEVTEPTPIQYHSRQSGRTEAMIERMLDLANERGIRVEVVYPKGEVSERAVTILAKHMANVASDWVDICDDDDHPLEHSNWGAYTDDARRALAALGGGEHAE